MTSKAVSRSCEDIDEATLSYAEIKAVATGNPLIREKMEVDNDVQRLKLLKASYDNQRYGLQDNFMIKYPKLIKTATEKLANVALIIERVYPFYPCRDFRGSVRHSPLLFRCSYPLLSHILQ